MQINEKFEFSCILICLLYKYIISDYVSLVLVECSYTDTNGFDNWCGAMWLKIKNNLLTERTAQHLRPTIQLKVLRLF